MVISTSEFRRDDVGRDGIHWANGSVSIIERDGQRYLQLGDDFNTGPAPDLYIYTATDKVVDEGTFWDARDRVELAKLKSGSGAQAYHVNHDFSEVIIWCKRFGAFIGAATVN